MASERREAVLMGMEMSVGWFREGCNKNVNPVCYLARIVLFCVLLMHCVDLYFDLLRL